jgi:hypothetical protein
MLVDYFNDCACACSLGIATQIKNMGPSLFVFADIWYDIYVIIFWMPSKIIRDCVMDEEFKDLED